MGNTADAQAHTPPLRAPDKCHGSTHASSLISGTLKGPGPDATIVRGIDPRPPTRRLGARLLDCHRLGTADPIRRLARPSRRHRHVGEGLPERGDPPPGGGGDRWDVQLIEDVEVTGVITTTSQTCGLPGTRQRRVLGRLRVRRDCKQRCNSDHGGST